MYSDCLCCRHFLKKYVCMYLFIDFAVLEIRIFVHLLG